MSWENHKPPPTHTHTTLNHQKENVIFFLSHRSVNAVFVEYHCTRRMLLTNPQGTVINCNWIEPPIPGSRDNLYLSLFSIYTSLLLFSSLYVAPQQQGFSKKIKIKRPVNCLPPSNMRTISLAGVWFGTWTPPMKQNGKFPLHLICSQSVRNDPDKEYDIDGDGNKDVFSPQAFLLIRANYGGNKWILTKCRMGGGAGRI